MKLCAWKVVLLFIKQSTDITKAKYPTLSKLLIMYQWSRIVFIVILLFFVTNNNAGDGVCMNKQDCSENNVETQENLNLYAEVDNEYIGRIEEAIAEYKPCKENNCSCYAPMIEHSLRIFKNGITKNLIDDFRRYGTKYQIINHKLYRQVSCMFPSRCEGIEYFLKESIDDMPDIEMLINCRDWPQIDRLNSVVGAIFSFSRTDAYYDIMYPAWSFRKGGPSLSLHPAGLGRWDQFRSTLNAAAKKWPWSSKKPVAFFRGSRTSPERDGIVLLSREQPHLVDAHYTKNQAWKSMEDTLNAPPAVEISLEDHCQYKFLFNYRGVAASFRLKHLFLCNSLVFHVGDEWKEFFYDSLKPWVHYVPLDKNPTAQDIKQVLEFFRRHDSMARKIAERGRNHIWNHLKMSDVHCYWRKLLLEYSQLLKFKVARDAELIEI